MDGKSQQDIIGGCYPVIQFRLSGEGTCCSCRDPPIGGVLRGIELGQCKGSTEEFIDTWVSRRRDLWRRSRCCGFQGYRLVPGHILSLSVCFLAIRRLVVFCRLCFPGLDVGPQQQYNNGAKHGCVKTFGIMS